MCSKLNIARSAYYKWLKREIPAQEQENAMIATLVLEYDERFGHILGYRRMTLWINELNGKHYGKNRIHRIMQALNVHAVIRKKGIITQNPHQKILRTIFSKETLRHLNRMRNGLQMLQSAKFRGQTRSYISVRFLICMTVQWSHMLLAREITMISCLTHTKRQYVLTLMQNQSSTVTEGSSTPQKYSSGCCENKE